MCYFLRYLLYISTKIIKIRHFIYFYMFSNTHMTIISHKFDKKLANKSTKSAKRLSHFELRMVTHRKSRRFTFGLLGFPPPAVPGNDRSLTAMLLPQPLRTVHVMCACISQTRPFRLCDDVILYIGDPQKRT